MALISRNRPPESALRIELWSWATWLVLCVISYPTVVVIWTAPRAGLLAGLALGAVLIFAASLGYAGRAERFVWPLHLASSLASGGAIAAVAFFADGADPGSAALCGIAVAAEMMFIWHFLPWIVRDADPASPPGETTLQLLRTGPRAAARIRPALSLVLLLAFLGLGLGAAWSRGDASVPAPTAWLITLAFLTFVFMFVERISFFEHSARHGNLLLPPRSYRTWIGAGLAFLLFAAMLAAIPPRNRSPETADPHRAGRAAVQPPAAPASKEPGIREEAGQALAAARQFAVAVFSVPPLLLALWLLLLLLLIALILLRGFRRSRAAGWIRSVLGRAFSLAARACRLLTIAIRRLLSLFAKAQTRQGAPGEDAEGDPFFNPFDDPQAAVGLSPREIVIRTYHLLLNFAEMLGHGRGRGQTPFEYADLLRRAAPSAGDSLKALTWAYAGAMYGGDHFAPPDPSAVHRSWERINAALTEGMSLEDLALRRRAYLAARALETNR